MKSTISNLILLWFLSVSVVFSGCIPEKQALISPAAKEETSTPTTASEVSVERFYRIANDANYLNDCRRQYPSVSNQQAGFRGIYPGKIIDTEALENLGEPRSRGNTSDGYEERTYYDENETFAYHIFTKDTLVDSVIVEGDGDREITLTLKNFLIKYGCPDLIITADFNPSSSIENLNYNTTFFVYHTMGLEIRFEGYPVRYSDLASIIVFTKPLSLRDFLENGYGSSFLVDEFSSPVSLEDAVKEN